MHARILLGVSRSRGQEKVLGETKGSLLKGLPDFPPYPFGCLSLKHAGMKTTNG